MLALALVLALISIWLHLRADSLVDIVSRLRNCEAELADVIDRTTHWMKRENVRRARDAKEEQGAPKALDSADPKAELRQRARLKGIRV